MNVSRDPRIVESKRTFDLRMAYEDSLEQDRQDAAYGKYDEPQVPSEPEPKPEPTPEPESKPDPDEGTNPWDEDTGEYDYPDAPDFRGGLKRDRLLVLPISGGAPLPTDADYEAWSSILFAGEYDDETTFTPTDADLEDVHMAGREPGVYGYQ